MERQTNLGGSLVLRGVLAILFGAAAVFWPGLTLTSLLYIFSGYLLLNGVVDLVFGINRVNDANRSAATRWLMLAFGAGQVGVAVYLLRHVDVRLSLFILLVGFTLIVRGVFEVVEGLFEVGSNLYRTVLLGGGVLAALAGALILLQDTKSGIAFVWVLGIYALVIGPMLLALALEADRASTARGRR